MTTAITDWHKLVLQPYAWPGGYQINYVDESAGDTLCFDCACKDDEATFTPWIHWEGESDYCADCNKELVSEYGIPDHD